MIKSDSVFNNNFILPCCCLKDNIKGRLQVDNTVAVILSVAFDNTARHATGSGKTPSSNAIFKSSALW